MHRTRRTIHPIVVLPTALVAVVLLASPVGSQGPVLRRLVEETRTPGLVLGQPPPAHEITLPAVADVPELPDSWRLDPATGAYYRKNELLVKFRARPRAQVTLASDDGDLRVFQPLRGQVRSGVSALRVSMPKGLATVNPSPPHAG